MRPVILFLPVIAACGASLWDGTADVEVDGQQPELLSGFAVYAEAGEWGPGLPPTLVLSLSTVPDLCATQKAYVEDVLAQPQEAAEAYSRHYPGEVWGLSLQVRLQEEADGSLRAVEDPGMIPHQLNILQQQEAPHGPGPTVQWSNFHIAPQVQAPGPEGPFTIQLEASELQESVLDASGAWVHATVRLDGTARPCPGLSALAARSPAGGMGGR